MGIKSEAGLRVGSFKTKIILDDAHFMHTCIKAIVTEKWLSDSNAKRGMLYWSKKRKY